MVATRRVKGVAPVSACWEAAGVERRSATVASDYLCGWPLWLDGGGVAGDWFAEEQGLSPGLRRDLVTVQALFDERFDSGSGWRGVGDDSRYAAQMVDVFLRLGRELGDGWDLTLDLWPVTDEAILKPLRRRRILLPRRRH